MDNVIYYDKFMSERTILHSDTAKNYSDGILFLVENKSNADIITYDKTDKFLLLLVGVLRADENDNYYYEYSVDRVGDIIDNIKFKTLNKNIKTKISYYIGGYLYEPDLVKEFIFCASQYHEFKIRITFLEKPTNELEFIIYSRVYLLDTEYRNKLANNTIITKTNIYRDGMCCELNNFTKESGRVKNYIAYDYI
jgi:hypothetical protein